MAKRWISSENYVFPVILALAVHVLVFSGFFMVWSSDPDVPEVSKPTMIAKLYELNSRSPATTQTSAKIAGEADKTRAPVSQDDQIATRKEDPKPVVDQQAIKKAQEQAAADAKKKADALAKKQADEAKKKADALAKKQADDAKKKADALAKKQADDAKKKADALAKKQADDAKKKADALAKKQADAAIKAKEDRDAKVLAELIGDKPTIAASKGDQLGDSVAGSYNDLIAALVKANWVEFTNAPKGTSVTLLIDMLPDGTITNAKITHSSGDPIFDNSAVTAARNVGRVPEIQKLDAATFNRLYRQKSYVFIAE